MAAAPIARKSLCEQRELNGYIPCTVRRQTQLERPSIMSLVRLLGFSTLACGCLIGRYREVATSRDVRYVEEKGRSCTTLAHRRNHTLLPERAASSAPTLTLASRAS